MGIFYDHGVQYMVVTKSQRYVIVPLKDADRRLEQSEYYKARKNRWFSGNGSFSNPIPDGELDIEMTDAEKERLRSVLDTTEGVESHGWYDVQNIYDTYGI